MQDAVLNTVAPITLGSQVDKIQDLKIRKKRLEAQAEELSKEITEEEQTLLAMMDLAQTTKAAGRTARVDVEESVYPSVKDWDRFYGYIHRMKYYHLLQRRVSVTGCRELFDRNGQIPGVEPFTKRSPKVTPI